MTKLSMRVVNRGVATMMIRHSRGQWIMLGNFRVILGFSFYCGITMGLMTVVVIVERMIIVCWSVTLCLGGFPANSEICCWFRIL